MGLRVNGFESDCQLGVKCPCHLPDELERWLTEDEEIDEEVVEEDDCIIFPAILRHFVRNQNTDKLRVTIASNIYID